MNSKTSQDLYELLKRVRGVGLIENEIYIYETSKIDNNNGLQPLKTDCSIICICLEGELKAIIDLREYYVKSPSLVICQSGQIIESASSGRGFRGILIFMAAHFTENFRFMSGYSVVKAIKESPHIELDNGELQSILNYCNMVRKVIKNEDNPNRLEIIIHLTIAYYYGLGYYLHKSVVRKNMSKQEILAEKFLQSVRRNYKTQRKVEYYATLLELSSNYLSHVIKSVTGKTAGEWIDDYTALEAKALLKSTNMTIQQIADELNFPTQSFFGKFFKRMVGVAPKYYK